MADGLSGAGYTGVCAIAPTPITLTQTADSLHGIADDETFLICTPTGGAPDTSVIIAYELAIRGAEVDGAISFEIDGDYWNHEGDFAGGGVGGIVSLRTTNVTGSEVTFVGGWEINRD